MNRAVGGLGLAAAAGAALACGARRERRRLGQARERLLAAAGPAAMAPLDASALDDLPPPARRYLLRAVGNHRTPVRVAEFGQRGELRGSTAARRWMRFEAAQLVVPAAPGFLWDAKVDLVAPVLHLRLRDALIDGRGSGAVSLCGALPIAGDEPPTPEMDAGALHRYLAEAVWTPTALWPSAALRWSAIDGRSALARLTTLRASVGLEFRFDAAGDVASVYAEARWQRVEGRFEATPWEGRFGAPIAADGGLRVPSTGEVGWIEGGAWRCVWRGRVIRLRHEHFAVSA